MEVDVEKVLKGEPLIYDRHLVVLQRYEGSTQVSNLCFNTTSFWVQIHNLPFSLLTVEATFSLRETIGTVLKLKDTSEMKKGSFMRVRVAIDVTNPLCRGRKVTWDHEGEG